MPPVNRRKPSLALTYLLCLLALALLPARAIASDSKAAAEALFVAGRNLMEQGSFDEACSKFEASQRLDPGLGTMLNLAQCYEKSGRTASAWAQYREAIPAARAAGSDERASLAEERARALEARLSTLTLRILGDMGSVKREVSRDGMPVDRGAFSTAIPVDPGTHEIAAQAPGYEPWSIEAKVGQNGDHVVVDIPVLEPMAELGTAPAPPSAVNEKATWPAQKTWSLVSGGVGLLALGAGGVFALVANAELSAAKTGCPSYPNGCSPESREHNDNAQTFGDVATGALIVGGVGLALGAVLWLTAPKKRPTQLGFRAEALQLKGTF